MFFLELLLALFIGLILTGVFAAGFQRARDWDALLAFFVIVFLASWIGGLWIAPVGPVVSGIYWLPFVVVGIIVALLLAALSPPSREERLRRLRQTRGEPVTTEESTAGALLAGFGIFFWILMLVLLILVFISYLPGIRPIVGSTGAIPVDDVIEDPIAFYGELITVDGVVGEAIGGEAFILWDEDVIDINQERILVISETTADPDFFIPAEDTRATVTGRLYEFIISDLDAVVDYDLDTDVFVEYTDVPVLVADDIIAIP